MLPTNPVCGMSVGLPPFVSAITTMTASKIYSSRILDKISYIEIMAMVLSLTLQNKPGYSVKFRAGAPGCTFVDYNRDGHLDLFVSNYLQFDFVHVPKPGANSSCTWKGLPVECGPRGLPPGYHSLYRNNGDGTFTDVSKQAGVSELRGSYGMTVVAADFNEDGWPDIYVACDSTPSLLLMNNGKGAFL